MSKFRFQDLEIWKESLLEALDHLCRKITNFQRAVYESQCHTDYVFCVMPVGRLIVSRYALCALRYAT